MNKNEGREGRPSERHVGIWMGIGSGLGAAIGAITGDWYWIPITLGVCCTALGVLHQLRRSRAKSSANEQAR